MVTFADLGVPDDLIEALDSQGIGAPFPIQTSTIPAALARRDVSGRAPTGSGKTLAFGIPLVANVQRARPKRPRALVLVPTRELAAQVCRDLTWLGAARGVRAHAFYGGTRFEPQIKALRQGVDIAVACPGRLADLINQGIVRLDGVDLVVVDEADRMADMGFLPEVRRLVDQTSDDRQTLLFSATLDGDVDELVRRYQHDPVTVDVTPEVDDAKLEHHFWSVPHAKRVPTTAAIIQQVGPTVVFTRTRYGADRVARQLEREGITAEAIHGARSQNQRERALRAFRTGHAQALVATDVAARGIHVDDVRCVVHFDLPTDPKDYVHRSGRTGRAGATGVVVALAMPDRRKDTKKLLRELKLGVTVAEPDFSELPVGAPRPVTTERRRRNDDRRDRSGGRGPHGRKGPKHKPSGSRPKKRFDSPDQTGPGRKKRTPGGYAGGSGDRVDKRGSGPSRGPKSTRPKGKGGPSSRPGPKKSAGHGAGSGSGEGRGPAPRTPGRKPVRKGPDHTGSRPTGPKRPGTKPGGPGRNGPKAAGPKRNGPKRKPGTNRRSDGSQSGHPGRRGPGGKPRGHGR